jgi:hypothetical protein
MIEEVEQFDLEKALEAISENFDAEDFEEKQKEPRAALKRHLGQQDAADRNYQHGIRAINLATVALSRLDSGNKAHVSLIQFELTRLAEGYFLVGEIDKAYGLTPDPLKRTEYAQTLNALSVSEKCQCRPDTFQTAKGQRKFSPRRKKARLFYNGQKYTIFNCVNCGTSYHA